MTKATGDYTRIAYHARKATMDSGAGFQFEQAMTLNDVGLGGVSVPAEYEQAPAAVIIVSNSIEQSEVIEAIRALTGQPILARLLEVRKPEPNRFPRREYEELTPEQQTKVCEQVRLLAAARQK